MCVPLVHISSESVNEEWPGRCESNQVKLQKGNGKLSRSGRVRQHLASNPRENSDSGVDLEGARMQQRPRRWVKVKTQ